MTKPCLRALLLSVFSAVIGCGAISFDVTQNVPEQTVQGSPLAGVLPSVLQAPFKINIDAKSETEKRNTGPASSAALKQVQLTATPHASPSGNFDFVDEIHIFVEATNGGTLPKVEIATLKPVPKGQTTLNLVVVPGVDLLPYINAGAQISATASGHQPAQTVTYDGSVTVTIRI
jgi:hypothetical protein